MIRKTFYVIIVNVTYKIVMMICYNDFIKIFHYSWMNTLSIEVRKYFNSILILLEQSIYTSLVGLSFGSAVF